MKNFKNKLILAGALLLGLAANAQSGINVPLYMHDPRVGTLQEPAVQNYAKSVARDSVHSGTTVLAPTTSFAYAQVDSIQLTNNYKSASIQTTITWVSGTTAGSMYLQGSVDGTAWQNVSDTATIGTVTSAGSTSFIWEVPGAPRHSKGNVTYNAAGTLPYLYYRVFIAGTGTWCGKFYTAIEPRQ